MQRGIYKRIIAIILSLSICVTLLSVPVVAESFPYFAEIANTPNGSAGIYSQPGTPGHEAGGAVSERLTSLSEGRIVKIIGTGIDGDGDMWYQIGYGDSFNSVGYVYEKRVNKVADGYVEEKEFENWLTEQGFPESYKSGLRDLHTLYPNWKFYADHTGLDFNAAVKAENGEKYISNSSDDSWKIYEKGEYNWDTGKWKGYDGDSWIKTTDQVVAYHMDPRNFFDPRNVFMFANESFNADKEDLSFVQNAVKGTFMDAVLPEYATKPEDEQKTYADAILEAAKQSGVSTATIAALIRQEQGAGKGDLISGKYIYREFDKNGVLIKEVKDFIGYYNFFNIGAYAEPSKGFPEPAYRGLWWAKGAGKGATTYNRPWNTREKAIIGGAVWYGGNYVSVGQNTIYYKNFNVYKNTEHDVYTHQYATNIEDSKGKGSMMAQGMSGIVDGEIIFHIPVYKNMPEKTTLPAKGTNNNRFLESLSIDGFELSTTFDRYTYSYEAIVPYESAKVKIIADAAADDAKVSGAGEVELAVGNNDLKITVTSSSGLTATYNLSVHRDNTPVGEAPMPELNTDYKIGDYMTNIQPDTSIATFKTNLGVKNGKAVVMDSLGNEKKDVNSLGKENIISTGDFVHLYDTNEKIRATYRVVIYGDIDGNGKVNAFDLLVGQRHMLKKKIQASIYVTAMDIDGNGEVNAFDLLVGQRHALKIKPIEQQR